MHAWIEVGKKVVFGRRRGLGVYSHRHFRRFARHEASGEGMSGVAGQLLLNGENVVRRDIERMANALHRYGPDRSSLLVGEIDWPGAHIDAHDPGRQILPPALAGPRPERSSSRICNSTTATTSWRRWAYRHSRRQAGKTPASSWRL